MVCTASLTGRVGSQNISATATATVSADGLHHIHFNEYVSTVTKQNKPTNRPIFLRVY